MPNRGTITIHSNKQDLTLNISSIWYVLMDGNTAYLHVSDGGVYPTRITMVELEEALGDDFLKIKRGCLVSVTAIHNITDKVNLCNGQSLSYVVRKKRELQEVFQAKQARIIERIRADDTATPETYAEHYRVFDTMPIAFADIEMVFNGEFQAVDWIFRYANPALAELERLPLEQLVGNSFATLFPNMDAKWLRSYERATIYGETLKIVDYSPEIDRYLDIICFPTFKGHCGCILFDLSQFKAFRRASNAEKAMSLFLTHLLD